MVMTIGLKYTLGSWLLGSGSCEISDLFTDAKKRFESGEKQESPDYAGTYIHINSLRLSQKRCTKVHC